MGSAKIWKVGRKREAIIFWLLVVPPAVTAVNSGLQENICKFQVYSAGLQGQQILLRPNNSCNGRASSYLVIISQKLRT